MSKNGELEYYIQFPEVWKMISTILNYEFES